MTTDSNQRIAILELALRHSPSEYEEHYKRMTKLVEHYDSLGDDTTAEKYAEIERIVKD